MSRTGPLVHRRRSEPLPPRSEPHRSDTGLLDCSSVVRLYDSTNLYLSAACTADGRLRVLIEVTRLSPGPAGTQNVGHPCVLDPDSPEEVICNLTLSGCPIVLDEISTT